MSNETRKLISTILWFVSAVLVFLLNLVFGFSPIGTILSLYSLIVFGLKLRALLRPDQPV